jgi:exopolysaccharide/PEP-CTERM locus tyrosine autokinase
VGKVFKALKRAEESVGLATDEVEDVISPSHAIKVPSEKPVKEALKAVAAESRKPPVAAVRETVDAESKKLPGQWDNRLVLSTSTTGAVAESIRALRTRVLHPSEGQIPRSLLITSASPGEGKSFVCANLGISLAQGVDNHCLLVDCDLRQPTQHVLFGLENNAGLSDYLQHKKELPELLVPSGIEKLSILQAGPRSINPAELLGSASMASLVDELAQRYDDRIVLFDSPPLHAASETAILAQHVDGVILVVRYGVSRREYVKTLVEAIGREKIVGVVFNAYKSNMLDSKVFGYYEYQQNYYYKEK